MNEPAIRAMIREAIAKHTRAQEPDYPAAAEPAQRLALASHASHFRYALPGSGEACLIEPAVQCNHCGYCQSHGH
jgi:hypothetical protein